MKTILVNNKAIGVEDNCALSKLPEIIGQNPEGIAIAVNNKVIKREDWERTMLEENAKVIIIKAVCGG
jgi:sulfur carrier protein